MTLSLDQILSPEPVGAGAFRLPIPPGWEQGRAVFGGLVLGGMVRALAAAVGQPGRRLRSLSAELVGVPAIGEARIATRILRAGGVVTTATAELSQGEALCAHAVGVFGGPRAVAERLCTLPPPESPPFSEVPIMDRDNPFAPAFARNFEYRPLRGFPFTGDPSGEVAGWIRPRAAAALRDDAYLVAQSDVWWPAVLSALDSPRPAVTLGFSVELYEAAEDLDGDAPLLHRGRVLALRDGYATETRELWSADLRPVALGRQLVCIVK